MLSLRAGSGLDPAPSCEAAVIADSATLQPEMQGRKEGGWGERDSSTESASVRGTTLPLRQHFALCRLSSRWQHTTGSLPLGLTELGYNGEGSACLPSLVGWDTSASRAGQPRPPILSAATTTCLQRGHFLLRLVQEPEETPLPSPPLGAMDVLVAAGCPPPPPTEETGAFPRKWERRGGRRASIVGGDVKRG